MPGFEDYLANGAGQSLPDLQAPEQPGTAQPAADIAASTDNTPAHTPVNNEPANTEASAAASAQSAAAEAVVTTTVAPSLEEISGGRVKDVEALNSILEQAQRAETLQKTIDDWNAKYGENPYADSFEETRNLLKKQGATETQLKQLEEITNLGALTDLSPLDIRVKAMVLRDNVKPEIAERIIKEQAGITDFMDDDAKEVAETKLQLSSKEDLKYLQEYKDKLAPVDNSTAMIQREAATAQAKEALKPISEQFKSSFAELKDFNITGSTKPEDAINFTFKTAPEFVNAIPQLTEQYIIGTGKPVNAESIADAQEYIESLMWARYGKDYLKTAVNHAIATTTEKLVDKYENHNRLDNGGHQALVADDMDAFYKSVAR